MTNDGWDESAVKRSQNRMKEIDSLPEDLRHLVYEHGWSIIKAFIDSGIKKKNSINHIIYTVREGSFEIGKREGENLIYKSIPLSEEIICRCLDFFKIPPISKQIIGHLIHKGQIIVPTEPSEKMIQASMDAVKPISEGGRPLTKHQKHKIRLRAAMKAAMKEQMTGYEPNE